MNATLSQPAHKVFVSLVTLFAAASAVVPAQAGIMHSDATLITYTDFGQNAGRYKTTESANALLQHIRQQEGGVTITYTGGQSTYVMPHGMIDFGSAYHVATCAAISPSAVATVAHNYTFNSRFSNKVYGIGSGNAVKYKGIELGEGTAGDSRWNSDVFSHALSTSIGNATDHRVMRLSKVITDAPYAELYDTTGKNLSNLTYYHAGSGQQWRATYDTNTLVNKSYPNNATQLISAYNYVIGGIVSGAASLAGSTGYYSREYFNAGGISKSDPLTWVSRPGDSGSPLYVWDDVSGTYQYIGSNRGEILSGQVGSCFVTNTSFDKEVVEERYTKQVNIGSASTLYLNAVNIEGETVTDSRGYGTTKWSGTVTDGTNTLAQFVGVKTGLNTWNDLSGLKDTQNWYAYDESYVAQSNQDLFFTENLVFNASAPENNIVLTDTVDLGIGYAEFNGGKFTVTSEGDESNLFNHAGYVINAGAEVHVRLTNPAEYMREWRKIGAGNLYIEGDGNNDILLNVGGSGSTYLNRGNGGYAAYSVLVNTGATVVINDINQIKRDLTFGNRGGVLDMNGNSMDWYSTAETADAARDGFSVNALTEDAVVANYTGSATLTYREAGNTTFCGSFADSTKSSLKIVYDAAEGSWTLNGIRTRLQNADSGLQVNAGKVVLCGTNTIHATGSATGTNENRYFHEDDWHYADAAMNVSVANGATFELGSHARLTGDVSVEEGGTYLMREGVRHTMEYVEGGQVLENTDKYSAFFGHKGDVQLNGGSFAVQFNEGTDSVSAYSGNVSGNGAMTVDAGTDGGTFSYSGTTDAGVSKTLERGQLSLSGAAANDTANKWVVNAGGVMVQFNNAAETLGVIDGNSTGTLGLSDDTTAQLDLSGHAQLGIGALSGKTVQYGDAGTSERLTNLKLGGNGNLVVNFLVAGTDTLNVNAGNMRGGEIRLQNVAADYSGTVNVQAEGGQVFLTTGADGALNGATVNINSGGVFKLSDDHHSLGGVINVNSGGLLQGKDMVLQGSSARVELGSNMQYDSFSVRDGATLNLLAGGRLDANHAVAVDQGGIMRLNSQTLQDKVEMKNGGIMYGNGGTVGTAANVKAVAGTGVLNAENGTFNVNGQIGASEGATLRLENGTFNIYTGSINAAGGTLELACSTVNLGHKVNFATQNIGGTLSIVNNVTINADQTSTNYQSPTHNINHLHIAGGSKLTLNDSSSSWNHTYNLAALTGEGTIQWNSNIYWYYAGTSRMILSGDNSFTGTLIVNQQNNDGSMQHVSLAHENAAKNMVINLWGDSNSRPGLAISTGTARIAGVGGTANTFVYAGAVKTAGNGNNPASTSRNTLVINTSGTDHTYNGTLLGDASYGLNLVKEGAGTQTFTNSANVVHDVSAMQGHLNFTNAPAVHGDVSIATGARLTIGSGAFSLDAGHVLNVLTGASGQTATLSNALTLNGGTLNFNVDATTLSAGTPSISLGGLSANAEQTTTLSLNLMNTATLTFGQTYKLANQDWSSLNADSINVEFGSASYLAGTLSRESDGLKLQITGVKEGFSVWSGSTDSLADSTVAVFNNTADNKTVELGAGTSVDGMFFDSTQDYTVSAADGQISINSLRKESSGKATISSAITVSGSTSVESGTLTFSGESTTLNGELSVNGGNVIVSSGMLAVSNANLSIASGAELNLEGNASLNLGTEVNGTLNKSITGTGTIVWGNTAGTHGHGTTISLSENFTGTLQTSGKIQATANTLSLGGTKKLVLDGVWFWGNSGVTEINADVEVTSTVQANQTSCNFYQNGENGGLKFNGNFSASGKIVAIAQGSTTFAGTTTEIGTLNITGGTTNFSGETANVGTLNLSGGNGTLNSGTLTVSNANLTIASGSTLSVGENAVLNLGAKSKDSTAGLTNITGVGKVIYGNASGGAHNTTISLSENFTGTLQLSGNIQATASSLALGGTKNLILDGVWMWGNSDASIVADVLVTDSTQKDSRASGNFYRGANGGNLTFTGNFDAAGKTVVLAAGTTTFAGTTTEIGSLNQAADAGLTLSGGSVNIGTLTQTGTTGGTLSFVGTETNFSGNSATVGKLELKNGGNATLGNAENKLSITTDKLQIHNANGATTEALTVNSGTTLNITSADKTNTTNAGVLLGHWKEGKGVLNVNGGIVNAKSTLTMVSWNSDAKLNINGGEYNAYGIVLGVSDSTGTRTREATINLSEEGRLNVGESGIKNLGSGTKTINLSGGTLGAFADWSSSMAMTLSSNSTIDTENSDGSGTGHQISLSGALSGSGALEKSGTGTLELSGENNYSGGTLVRSGTLIAASEKALGDGAVSVASGAVLQANAAITFSTEAQSLTLVVGEAQVVPAVATYSFRSSAASGTALITTEERGSVTISGDAKLYVDISDLDGKLSGDSVALKLAAESALEMNRDVIEVGAWTENASGDLSWAKSTTWFVQDYSAGTLTLAIPEPSLFGVFAGLAGLALAGTRRHPPSKKQHNQE